MPAVFDSSFDLPESLLGWRGGYAIYPPRESLAEAEPRPNFPAEDKSHNLRANLVDLASTTVMQLI